jgi:hypothetical protein
MKIKFDRIISIATLVAALVAIILVLKKPAPVAPTQAPMAVAEHAAPNEQGATASRPTEPSYTGGVAYAPFASSAPAAAPASQSAAVATSSNTKADPTINSDGISAAVAKMLGGAAGGSNLTPDSNVGSGEPTIKDQQVTMDGDIVHGRFLTQIAGKDVWVTISGHMGEKDGYATFDPTEFKVGDMNVPVSLVNPALQRKLAEERDRLKLPESSSN